MWAATVWWRVWQKYWIVTWWYAKYSFWELFIKFWQHVVTINKSKPQIAKSKTMLTNLHSRIQKYFEGLSRDDLWGRGWRHQFKSLQDQQKFKKVQKADKDSKNGRDLRGSLEQLWIRHHRLVPKKQHRFIGPQQFYGAIRFKFFCQNDLYRPSARDFVASSKRDPFRQERVQAQVKYQIKKRTAIDITLL